MVAALAGRFVEMAEEYIQAAAASPKGSVHWANCTAAAFDLLLTPECVLLPKPEWWHDRALKTLSKTVVNSVDNGHGHMMRATVLSGQQPAWELSPRSAADLKEAAKHYSLAAKLVSGSPSKKLEFGELAATHLRKAAATEAAEAATQAAEAEAKAVVRAGAEAKANAAADALLALLAEEEAEMTAAATRAGKAPSKGSKGKGKSKSSGKR